MLQALLWDHDGVLVDTERLYFQATRELLAVADRRFDSLDELQRAILERVGTASSSA